MKTIYLILLLFFQTHVAYATDWDKLIEQAPVAKRERLQMDDNGYVVANVAKFPSGKSRFLGFTSFGIRLKPVLTVDSKEEDMQTLCVLGVQVKKPFKAKLEMQTNAAAGLQTGLFGSGNKLNQFENTVKVSPAVLSFSKKHYGWSLYDAEVMSKAKGTIPEYYADFLNAKLKESGGDTLVVDLSNMNALACDLMFGNLIIQAAQTVEFETGMPSQVIWVGMDQYTKIFRNYWKTVPALKGGDTPENQEIEAMALGVSAAPYVQAEELLKSKSRIQKFLSSVKTKIGNLEAVQKANISSREVMAAWGENTEYVKPSNEVTRQTLSVSDAPVFVKYVK